MASVFHQLLWHANMHSYIHTFLNIILWVHIMLLACMFSGLTCWHWTTKWCALPWGSPLPLPALLNCLECFVYGWVFLVALYLVCPPLSKSFGLWLVPLLHSLLQPLHTLACAFNIFFTNQVSFTRTHHTVTPWKKSSSKSFYLRSLGATFIIVLQFPKTAGFKEVDLPSLCQKTAVKIWFKY